MKTLSILLLTILCHAGYAQIPVPPPPPISQKVEPINVPGTKVYMITPPGGRFAKSFAGIEMDNALIQIMDLPGGNYYKNAATFSKAEFEAKGITVYDYREIILDSYPGKFISMQGSDGNLTYSLVFGDSTFSTMVMGFVSKDHDLLAEIIKASIFSIKYKKSKVVDPFAVAVFTVSDTSKLKFASYAANMYIFSYNPKADIETSKDQPNIMVLPIPIEESMTASSAAEQMFTQFATSGMSNLQIHKRTTISVNGYPACETEATFETDGIKKRLYQLMIKQGQNCLSIIGTSLPKNTTALKDFQNFARSIKFKK